MSSRPDPAQAKRAEGEAERPTAPSHHPRRLAARTLALLLAAAATLATGCRAQQPWPLWEHYAGRMIDGQGRVIDQVSGDRTTSEGEGYGMFFALVANDRTRFDHLLAWTEANLAGGDLTQRLPAWSWGKAPDGTWKVLDPSPASDADLWIAYDLLEAGRLWREPRYERLAQTLLLRIAQQEVAFVPGIGVTLVPGPVGFHPDLQTWLLNPSYLPPSLLARFATVQPDGPWTDVQASLLPILKQGSGAGFAMNWVAAGTTIHPSASPAELAAGNKTAVPVGSYDAIRVYLWLGLTDPATPGLGTLVAQLPAMSACLQRQLLPPEIVDEHGTVFSTNASPGFSAAVVPYLELLGRHNEARTQLTRLEATRDPATGLFGKQPVYYDQNLALFATGWTEHRFRFDRSGRLTVPWP